MSIKPGPNGCFTVYCDCCDNQKLAEVRGDKLIIMDRRHGKKHIAVVAITELSALAESRCLTKQSDKV